MPTDIKRVLMPSNPFELIDLGIKVYARHCIMGNKSPLLAIKINSWEENGPEVNNALRLHELIETDFNPSQEYFRKQDELLAKIKASLEASHDLLSDMYPDNREEFGFWGFNIEE